MGGFQFPILSVIIFTPIVAALIMLAIDASRRDLIRGIAITAASIVLVLSAAVYFGYNSQVSSLTVDMEKIAAPVGSLKRLPCLYAGWLLKKTYRGLVRSVLATTSAWMV